MDPGPHPVKERGKLALLDLCRDIGLLGDGLAVELGCQQVAQAVGGKVADVAHGPVYVLQYSQRVVGREDTQVLLHFGVPELWKIGELYLALQYQVFDLEAQHDVEVVGYLVGFDADEGGLDAVDGLIEGFDANPFQLSGKDLLETGQPEGPEAATAADDVLPHPGLRFVHAQRGAVAQDGAVVGAIIALVVHAVTRFVNGGKEGHFELFGGQAGGEAHVGWGERGREGVRRKVLASVPKVKAEALDDLDAKIPLLVDVELLGKDGIVDCVAPLGDGLHQGNQIGLQLPKEHLHLGGFHLWLKLVQQCIVDTILVAQCLSFLAV